METGRMGPIPRLLLQLQRISQSSLDHRLRGLHWRERMRGSEVVAPRNVDNLRRQLEFLRFKQADVCSTIQ